MACQTRSSSALSKLNVALTRILNCQDRREHQKIKKAFWFFEISATLWDLESLKICNLPALWSTFLRTTVRALTCPSRPKEAKTGVRQEWWRSLVDLPNSLQIWFLICSGSSNFSLNWKTQKCKPYKFLCNVFFKIWLTISSRYSKLWNPFKGEKVPGAKFFSPMNIAGTPRKLEIIYLKR